MPGFRPEPVRTGVGGARPSAHNLTFLVRMGKPMGTWQMQAAKAPLAETEDIEFPRDRSPGREVPL
jgi:hypothetical protein